MGTTSEKLTYLNTTKGKIKDSINLTGANITNEPFRQYSTKLEDAYIDIINNGTDTLYNNFPKVSGEGTSLTLNNTYQAPMRNNLKGNTSQTGTPTPTSPISVNVVSGDNTIKIEGKNLIQNEYRQGTYNNASDGRRIITKYGVYLTAGTQVALSIDMDTTTYRYLLIGTTIDGVTSSYIYSSGWKTSSSLIVTIADSGYYFVTIGYINETSSSSITPSTSPVNKLQLEKNNRATTYEPYQGNTYNIDLPSGIELCKIGNYQDYFYKDSDKWYWHREIGKHTLTGVEGWTMTYGTGLFSCNYENFMPIKKPNSSNAYSNYFVFDSREGGMSSLDNNKFAIQGNYGGLFIRNNDIANAEDFKTWLSTHNTSLYYVLATPTDTEITYQPLIDQLNLLEQAQSKENQTNISQINNDLPFIISASALKKGV